MPPTRSINQQAAISLSKALAGLTGTTALANATIDDPDDSAATRRRAIASVVAIVGVSIFVLLLFLYSALKTYAHHDSKAGARIRRYCNWLPFIPRTLGPLEIAPLGHFYPPRDDKEEASDGSPPSSAKSSPKQSPKERKISAARQRLQDLRQAKERYGLNTIPTGRAAQTPQNTRRGAAGRSVAFAPTPQASLESMYSQPSANGPSPAYLSRPVEPSPDYTPRPRVQERGFQPVSSAGLSARQESARGERETLSGRERAMQMLLGKASG